MATRARLRKERKEIAQQQVSNEMRERYLQQTEGVRKIMRWTGWIISGGLVVALAVYLIVVGIQNIPQFKMVTGPFGEIKQTELEANRFVTLHTDQGDIKIEVDPQTTPKAAANFVLLARKGFYSGTKFHRIVKGFMIQGGDPNSKNDDVADDGTGGPGYTFKDEKVVGEYTRGTVAMANSGANTNGSQFFIMHADSQLPKNYVIFGKVVSGMEVVDKIAETPVEANSQGEMSQPKEARVITTAEVTAN